VFVCVACFIVWLCHSQTVFVVCLCVSPAVLCVCVCDLFLFLQTITHSFKCGGVVLRVVVCGVVLVVSCVVWCCSCCAFVCVTCFSTYRRLLAALSAGGGVVLRVVVCGVVLVVSCVVLFLSCCCVCDLFLLLQNRLNMNRIRAFFIRSACFPRRPEVLPL